MIHHRLSFERVYDVRKHIAPSAWDYTAMGVDVPVF
jgi:hypothetical protein